MPHIARSPKWLRGTTSTSKVGPGVSNQTRILVIEDDRYVRSLLGDVLSAWGYETDVVADGREGLELFGRGHYDVVMTDLTMPQVSGLDVVSGVRDRDPSVAVIMLTAFLGDLESERRRLGFTVLRKPLDIDGLRRVLSESIGRPAAV
jgi:DNA-binding response OmpR family regulator